LKSHAVLPANQFEAGITKKHPEILRLKNELLDAGANYASMTGSGSTVFGLFTGEPPRKWPQAWYLRL
jgi:4-diphosphocytidyl-2-C-methyl-D-erythritol kinase